MTFEFDPKDYPAFVAAYRAYQDLVDAGQGEGAQADATFARMLALAPPDVAAAMDAKLKELGLDIRPYGVDADGRPVFDFADVTRQLGITEAEALAILAEGESHGLVTAVDPATVRRIH